MNHFCLSALKVANKKSLSSTIDNTKSIYFVLFLWHIHDFMFSPLIFFPMHPHRARIHIVYTFFVRLIFADFCFCLHHQFIHRAYCRDGESIFFVVIYCLFYLCRGTSGIDIDLRRVDIDQCPQRQIAGGVALPLNIFAGTDKCKARTTEVIYKYLFALLSFFSPSLSLTLNR